MDVLTKVELIRAKMDILKLKANDHDWQCYVPEVVKFDILKMEKEIDNLLDDAGSDVLRFVGGKFGYIVAKGDVYTIELTAEVWSHDVVDKKIMIDGEYNMCKSIEAFATNREYDHRRGSRYKAGETIGLLIRR
jgi:hypothetical protein